MERELGIPLIATNDSHYVADDDSRAHEILLCVQTAGSMNDPNRFKFDTQEFYIKSADEMHSLFADNPEVCTRTMQFVERCNLKLSAVDNPFLMDIRSIATSRRSVARDFGSALRRMSSIYASTVC
jgi:DNA polymerase-3 subunit alpha